MKKTVIITGGNRGHWTRHNNSLICRSRGTKFMLLARNQYDIKKSLFGEGQVVFFPMDVRNPI